MAAENGKKQTHTEEGLPGRQREEFQRRRGIELIIVAVMTVAVISVTPSAISLGWREVWLLPFLFLGAGICWVMYIRRLLTERERIRMYAVCSFAVVIFDGVHPTSLYGIAIMCALVLALFSQTEQRGILHAGFLMYLFLLGCQIVFLLRGESGMAVDSLLVSQLMLHTACVFIIYRIGLNIIRKHEGDRTDALRVIEELDFMRKRTENFMANVSHELRTPVNVVTGLSSVMEGRLAEEEDRQDAAHILEAGRRLSDQVDDILDFTEIETGRFTLTKGVYSVTSMVNDAVTALGIDRRKDLPEIIVDVDANLPRRLIGDERRIKKILLHLADNAIKFTKRGGGVYLNIYRIPEEYGINLCMEVKDTGIGMSGQALERLREGIYQEDAERNRENTGYGLGLRIVYGIVQAMGGFMKIESVPGEGTNIHVSLPQEVAEEERCMEVKNVPGLQVAFYQRQNKFASPRVLEYYLRMIGHVVRSQAITVQRVVTLEDCQALVEAHSFTHLFMSDAEYAEAPSYFDALCKEMQVIVVAQRDFRPTPFSRITILMKPLYAVPLVEVLNSSHEQEAKEALYGDSEVRFDGVKVLVVDDEQMNLIVAEGIFSHYGMEVETAGSGPEAIERISERDYDAVFMDHMMPGMDGVEAAHRIRDLLRGTGRRTRIIALTANAVSGAREMFLREGFDGFVAKPIERKELERTLAQVLSGGAAGAAKAVNAEERGNPQG